MSYTSHSNNGRNGADGNGGKDNNAEITLLTTAPLSKTTALNTVLRSTHMCEARRVNEMRRWVEAEEMYKNNFYFL